MLESHQLAPLNLNEWWICFEIPPVLQMSHFIESEPSKVIEKLDSANYTHHPVWVITCS